MPEENQKTPFTPDFSEFTPDVYDELRRLAHAFLGSDRDRHTLQPTALVNEAYLKLADHPSLGDIPRENLVRFAARVMRNVFVDYVRSANTEKRGGNRQRVSLSAVNESGSTIDIDVLALDEALQELSELSERKAQLIELRFFGGLTESEAAASLNISRSEATIQWRHARAWLQKRLRDTGATL
jgi:RNA polymerase sigma-70 factor (ECF subfamily)